MVRLHPKLMSEEFSLDDIDFPPENIPDFEWKDVDLTTQLTKDIELKIPIVSSPMDTVTGSEMAKFMALQGGIGVIHFAYPTVDDQIREVERVRRYQAGFVKNPITLGPNNTVGDVYAVAKAYGFYSIPITQDGTPNSPMVGFVAHRDVRYKEDMSVPLKDVMTPRYDEQGNGRLITANRRTTLDVNDIRTANRIIREHNLDTLPIVDDEYRVVALVTDSDLRKDAKYTLATKDGNKQLLVLVAVESRLEDAKERIGKAYDAGASGIVVDSRNIYRDHLEIAKYAKTNFPHFSAIIGNVVSPKVIRQILESDYGRYIDAFRGGIGGGELCDSTEDLGIGRPLGISTYECAAEIAKFADKHGPVGYIADGGIKSPRHIVGALMLGANSCMLGTVLGSLEQSPAPVELDPDTGGLIKRVRGMGSSEAIRDRAGAYRYGVDSIPQIDRYPEGHTKRVPYKGSGEKYLPLLTNGIRQTFHGLGFRTIADAQKNGYIAPYNRSASKGTVR